MKQANNKSFVFAHPKRTRQGQGKNSKPKGDRKLSRGQGKR